MLKSSVSHLKGPPDKVYNTVDTVIGLSYACCHSLMYSLNNSLIIFLAQLQSISKYCRILNNPHRPRVYSY
jgi:hypothetical protein